jgi:hypothetical protein
MAPEGPGRRKLTQAVANHVFCDVDWHMPAAIMDGNGVSYQLGENYAGSTPGPNDFFLSAFIHRIDLFQ